MPRITFPDFDNNSGTRDRKTWSFPYLAMDVVYLPIPAKDSYYGSYHGRADGQPDYYVARADNHRILGTIERVCDKYGKPKKNTWAVWPVSAAFRGDHFDDTTHDAMDKVPAFLSHSPRAGWNPLGGHHGTRDDAVQELLIHLYKNQAPVLGFGRHWEVERFESALRPLVKPTAKTMKAGPYPTIPVKDEYGCTDWIVPDGARPLRFDTPVAPAPRLTKIQVTILVKALTNDDYVSDYRSPGNITSLRKLHRLGYISEPRYGTRLTDTGRTTARRLLMERD